jgi:hypothetical protein
LFATFTDPVDLQQMDFLISSIQCFPQRSHMPTRWPFIGFPSSSSSPLILKENWWIYFSHSPCVELYITQFFSILYIHFPDSHETIVPLLAEVRKFAVSAQETLALGLRHPRQPPLPLPRAIQAPPDAWTNLVAAAWCDLRREQKHCLCLRPIGAPREKCLKQKLLRCFGRNTDEFLHRLKDAILLFFWNQACSVYISPNVRWNV